MSDANEKELPREQTHGVSPPPTEPDAESLEHGVQKAEAITSSWSIATLVIMCIFVYIYSFWDAMQYSTTSSLSPYVTSAFSEHSLLSTTAVLSSIFGGVCRFPIAKILDAWGRTEGFVLMMCSYVLGFILTAACTNVQTYAAAQVFYSIGSTGTSYCISILLADFTSLKNRMIVYGINSTQYIATTFAGPALAQRYLDGAGWRWGYGSFAIIMPVFALPIVAILAINQRKAKKLGLFTDRPKSGRNALQSIYFHSREYDVIGIFLIVAGFSLVLVPLTLAASATNKWATGYIIAMIVVGFVVLVAFCIWEKFFAPVSFIPFKYLKDRTVVGSCVLSFALYITYYCWDIYFSSYLQVVYNLSVRDAGWITNIYTLGSCFWGPIAGLLIRVTGRYKWVAMAAVPFSWMATGLLVYFRHPDSQIGYIAMTQIFIAFCGSTLVMSDQIAAMAVVSHNEVTLVLALEGVAASIGGAIGQSISGALWTNLLPQKLEEYLPDSVKADAMTIFGDLTVQLGYAVGTPERDAIIKAYAYVQRRMVLAGVGLYPLVAIGVLLWRNVNVKKVQQTRGTVF